MIEVIKNIDTYDVIIKKGCRFIDGEYDLYPDGSATIRLYMDGIKYWIATTQDKIKEVI